MNINISINSVLYLTIHHKDIMKATANGILKHIENPCNISKNINRQKKNVNTACNYGYIPCKYQYLYVTFRVYKSIL